jgi:hypothetical protein
VKRSEGEITLYKKSVIPLQDCFNGLDIFCQGRQRVARETFLCGPTHGLKMCQCDSCKNIATEEIICTLHQRKGKETQETINKTKLLWL